MEICNPVGFPNLFVRFTCNPKWPEIVRLLEPHKLSVVDQSDIVARVFRIKFEQLLLDLTKKHLSGKVIACKYYKLYIIFLIFLYI